LVKIAQEHDTTWQVIWNHPRNADHRAKRKSPDILYAGDVLHIPAERIVPSEPPPPSPPKPPPPPLPPVPWPYPFPPTRERGPTWECPTGECVCHPREDSGKKELYVLLLDHFGRPMPRARRVVEANGLVADAPENANEHGWLTVLVEQGQETITVAWAPELAPLEATYPYFHVYYVDLADVDEREAMRRRLSNLGFFSRPTFEENITDYRRCYLGRTSGTENELARVIAEHHDSGIPPQRGLSAFHASVVRQDADANRHPAPAPPGGTSTTRGSPPIRHGSSTHPGHGTLGLVVPRTRPRLRLSTWTIPEFFVDRNRKRAEKKNVVDPARFV